MSHPRGIQHHHHKLTADAVRAIRAQRKTGAKLAALAKQYGVAISTVAAVTRRYSYREVR